MKITFDWLKDHLKTNLKEKDLLEHLTNIGLEVESVQNLFSGNELFKVAKIIKTVKYSVGACFDMKEKPKKSGVKNQNNLLFSLIAKIKQ